MKKSQRLRLAALLAKGSNLNVSEQLEVAWLNALAAGNPDPSKDEDDSPSGFRVSLMEAVSGRKSLGAELTTAKARIAELESQLAAASKAAATVAALPEGALSADDAKKLRTDHATQLSALNAQLSVFGSVLGLKAEEITAKSEADLRAAVDKRLGALAGEKIAELGFPENKLPASSQSGSGASSGDELADIQAQLAAEKDPKKAGELAAKANALRDKQWAAGKN